MVLVFHGGGMFVPCLDSCRFIMIWAKARKETEVHCDLEAFEGSEYLLSDAGISLISFDSQIFLCFVSHLWIAFSFSAFTLHYH